MVSSGLNTVVWLPMLLSALIARPSWMVDTSSGAFDRQPADASSPAQSTRAIESRITPRL